MFSLRDLLRNLLARAEVLTVLRQSALWRFKNRKLYVEFQKNATNVFWLVDSVFKENEIKAWPEFGTLLGIIRDDGPIKHDLDLDFAVVSSRAIQAKIRKAMRSSGFKLVTESILKGSDTIIEEKYLISGVEVDIFYFVESGDQFIAYDLETTSGKSIEEELPDLTHIHPYRNPLSKFNLMTRLYQTKEINIPENLEQHLIELYGRDYQIPNPRWKNSMREKRTYSPDEIVELKIYRESET